MQGFHDLHCHLDFIANGAEVAAEAQACGSLLFANTVTPAGWTEATERFRGFDNVVVGFGMHPWWIEADHEGASPQTLHDREAGKPMRETSQRARHRQVAEQAEQAGSPDSEAARAQRSEVYELLELHKPHIIGEVGLDLGWKHVESRAAQIRMLELVAGWAVRNDVALMSLHSVKAARETIDVLEQTGAFGSCSCIFHWFTGSGPLLKRAIDLGGYFSCGMRMLATKKGREYVKAIPAKRLLLETDAPPEQGMPYTYAQIADDLASTAQAISEIKGTEVLPLIAQTSERLLGRR